MSGDISFIDKRLNISIDERLLLKRGWGYEEKKQMMPFVLYFMKRMSTTLCPWAQFTGITHDQFEDLEMGRKLGRLQLTSDFCGREFERIIEGKKSYFVNDKARSIFYTTFDFLLQWMSVIATTVRGGNFSDWFPTIKGLSRRPDVRFRLYLGQYQSSIIADKFRIYCPNMGDEVVVGFCVFGLSNGTKPEFSAMIPFLKTPYYYEGVNRKYWEGVFTDLCTEILVQCKGSNELRKEYFTLYK